MSNIPFESSQAFDLNRELMLDGNAVAGLFRSIFTTEMTTSVAECASCGKLGEMGTLLAFTQAPGIVLRCPACENVVLRIVETPQAFFIDARGSVFIKIGKSA